VRAFLGEALLAGARPIFVGDGLTDETGVAAASALGGNGIKVGRSAAATAARFSLPEVDAALAGGLTWDV
jgi:trehalose 6-phosphate phosphatase